MTFAVEDGCIEAAVVLQGLDEMSNAFNKRCTFELIIRVSEERSMPSDKRCSVVLPFGMRDYMFGALSQLFFCQGCFAALSGFLSSLLIRGNGFGQFPAENISHRNAFYR